MKKPKTIFVAVLIFSAFLSLVRIAAAQFGGSNQFGASASEPIRASSVTGALIPLDNSIPLPPELASAWTPTESGARLVGLAVVHLTTESRWHLYSPTQEEKPGGFPTTVKIPPATIAETTLSVGAFLPAAPVHYVRNDLLEETYEQMEGNITFAAPIFLTEKTANANTEKWKNAENTAPKLPETARLAGEMTVFACSDETCTERKFPLTLTVSSDADPAPILTALADEEKEAAQRKPAAEPNESFPPAAESTAQAATESSTESTAETPVAEQTSESAQSAVPAQNFSEMLWNLFKAFLGGMVLNVMPCVLPVIGLKIVSFFEQAGQSRSRAFRLNVWYSAGILSVFALLAMMSVGLSHLFTYGLFQIIMGGIVFAMALNLMGVWEISLPAFLGGKKSNELMRREGRFGAYFKGIITTLLAIPCGAPLLSAALVWADAYIKQGQTSFVLLVYFFIGLGMAFPYLTLGAFPELLRFLPKPGLWMETFRKIMGYVLLTAVVWILFSMPVTLVLPTVALLFALWFACWFAGSLPFDAPNRTRFWHRTIAVAVVLLTLLGSFNIKLGNFENPYTLENAMRGKMLHWAIRAERSGLLTQKYWQLYDRASFDAALASGKTVLLDFTADWCMNCKALESTVLHTERIESLADQKGIVTMTADLTNQNSPESADAVDLLDRFGGRQVPVVMIFTPKNPDHPTILRGLFTTTQLEEAIERELIMEN